jgi:DNA-binding LacI/PurR family transcriptional regulator
MRTTEPSRQRPPQAPVDIRTAMGRAGNQTIANRLRAVGDRWPDAVVVESGGRLSDAGEAAARVLLQLADRPSAILAQNDQLAFGALRAAAAMGVSVPHELTVTGFDGIELPGVAIELTTVAQPLRERGALAGRLIDGLIEGSPITTHVLPTTLIVGATSGPAPALRTPGPASSERARTPTTRSRHEHPEAPGRP